MTSPRGDVELVEIRMQVEVGSEPISGTLSIPGGEASAFIGWIALVTVLEDAVRAAASQPT